MIFSPFSRCRFDSGIALLLLAALPYSAIAQNIPLKQSTAGKTVPLPRFLDSLDGDTEETFVTVNASDIKLWKSGVSNWVNKNSGGATHTANGLYVTTLDATDTNTLGPLVIDVHPAGVQSVRLYCVVMPTGVYDALYGTTGVLPANTTHWGGTAVASANVRADVRQVDGAALGTHGSGQLPADVRQFGGANGIFASGRPEVTTSTASNTAIANADHVILGRGNATSSTAVVTISWIDEPAGGTGPHVDIVGCMFIALDEFGTSKTMRRIVSWDDQNTITLESAASFALDASPFVIVAAPPQLETIRTKTTFLPSATAGTAGGLFIAGSNANTTVNFTGNLSGSVGSVTAPVTTSAASNQAIAAADRAVLFTGSVDNAANSTTEVFVVGGAAALPAEVSGHLLLITHGGKIYVRQIVGFTGGGDALEVATLPFTPTSGDALAILATPP